MSIENKIRWGFGLALAFLLAIGVFSFLSARRSVEAFRLTRHAEKVLRQLELILNSMLDVETGGRGFALVGSTQFLEPFNQGQTQAKAALQELRQLIADDPAQQGRAARIEQLMVAKIAHTQALIDQRKSHGLEATADLLAQGEGKQMMDELRRLIAEMQKAEGSVRDVRLASAEKAAGTSIIVVTAGGLLAILLVGLAGALVRNDFLRRQQAETERDRFFELALDMLCIANSDGYFKRLSPSFTEILGWSVAELTSRPFVEFVHPDDREKTLKEVERQVKRREKVLQFENRYQHKDGSWRVLSWRSVPGEDGFMYATARDVTAQNKARELIESLNADLTRRAAQLTAANKELEAFSYSVSHDLRAPLRHIDGYAARLTKLTGDTLDEKSRRCVKVISDAAKEMGQLIDSLLQFSRTGRVEMLESEVDLTRVAQEAATAVQAASPGRNIVWRQSPLPRVKGDPALLKQVFANLLSNAVKYSRPRDPAIIEVGTTNGSPGETVFFVRDNGVGFEMDYSDKLFGVFQRLHRTEEFEGTGIGLANVRRIIERHGGRTWAEGEVDKGATFYFTLPVKSHEPH